MRISRLPSAVLLLLLLFPARPILPFLPSRLWLHPQEQEQEQEQDGGGEAGDADGRRLVRD